jgi:CRP/FNR family cyclic AMP-dependent transcriptional regulator
LRSLAVLGDSGERVVALTALGELADGESLVLLESELQDAAAPPAVRRAAAAALAGCGPQAIPALVEGLADSDRSVRDSVAEAVGRLGGAAAGPVAAALARPACEHGAIHALERLPTAGLSADLRRYAQHKVAQAAHLYENWRAVAPVLADPRLALLGESLLNAAQVHGLHALRAVNLIGDRQSLGIVIDALSSRNPRQRANAIETLESVPEAALLRPLLRMWDPEAEDKPVPAGFEDVMLEVLDSPDDWLRECGALAAGARVTTRVADRLAQLAEFDPDPLVRMEAVKAAQGNTMESLTTLSLMERILFLKQVPLFAGLPPGDLKQVAAIAGEMVYADGDVLAEQGEQGDECYVIVSGEVSVLVSTDGAPPIVVARRKTGDYVGEMAIISREPRIASLVSVGDVRTLCIDHHSFEQLLRERPEVSLAVMRTLCARLKELSK